MSSYDLNLILFNAQPLINKNSLIITITEHAGTLQGTYCHVLCSIFYINVQYVFTYFKNQVEHFPTLEQLLNSFQYKNNSNKKFILGHYFIIRWVRNERIGSRLACLSNILVSRLTSAWSQLLCRIQQRRTWLIAVQLSIPPTSIKKILCKTM